MNTEKNRKGVIVLLIIIILVLAVLCTLFATGTISFKNSAIENNQANLNESNNSSDNDISDSDKTDNQNNDTTSSSDNFNHQNDNTVSNNDNSSNQTSQNLKLFAFSSKDSFIETKDPRDNRIYKIYLSGNGEVFIESNNERKKLSVDEKVLYIELIQNEMDSYYSLVILTKQNNVYEYVVTDYKNGNLSPKLLKENITAIISTSIPGEYEKASGYVNIILGRTTNREYIELKLTRR